MFICHTHTLRFDYKLKSFIYVWCRKSFFSPFTHVLTHTLATELTKKKHKQLYALDFMINKKLKRNQLFSSLKTFLKDVLTFDLNQIINWYYVCTYDVFFYLTFQFKNNMFAKTIQRCLSYLIRFTFARFVSRLSLIIYHFFLSVLFQQINPWNRIYSNNLLFIFP